MQNFALVAVTAYFLSAMIGNGTRIPQPKEIIDHAVPQPSNVPSAVRDTVGDPILALRSVNEYYARSLESIELPSLIQRGGATSEPPPSDSSKDSTHHGSTPKKTTTEVLQDIYLNLAARPVTSDPTQSAESNYAQDLRYYQELAALKKANSHLTQAKPSSSGGRT